MRRRILATSLVTGLFCALFAAVLDAVTDALGRGAVVGLAFASGFGGSLLAQRLIGWRR